MFFIYRPLRILLGALIWFAIGSAVLWFMLTHKMQHQPVPLHVLAFPAALMLWAAWTAFTALRWWWAGVRAFYGGGEQ